MSKNFYARLDGVEYDQPALFDAAAKAAGRRKLPSPTMNGRWRTPSSRPFTPEDITEGAGVAFRGNTLQGERVAGSGQVWCKTNPKFQGPRTWWVVTDEGLAVSCHEQSMRVLGQCDDESLPLEASA